MWATEEHDRAGRSATRPRKHKEFESKSHAKCDRSAICSICSTTDPEIPLLRWTRAEYGQEIDSSWQLATGVWPLWAMEDPVRNPGTGGLFAATLSSGWHRTSPYGKGACCPPPEGSHLRELFAATVAVAGTASRPSIT